MTAQRIAVIAKSNSPYSPTNLGNVIDAIIADPATYTDPHGNVLIPSANASAGWTYDGSSFNIAVAATTIDDLLNLANTAFKKVLANGHTFNVASNSTAPVSVLCDGTNTTRADLALLVAYANAVPNGSRTWVDNNGVKTVLSSNEILSLAMQAGLWISDMYPALLDLQSQINAGTISTSAQVAAYVWPTV